MTWHVIRVRSKDAQKQLARTSLNEQNNYGELEKALGTRLLKWRKVLRIKITFYVTGQKIRYKKSCRCIKQVREARRRKINPFLLENDPQKILEQSQLAVERD